MAEEVGVGYVRLIPSMRGFGKAAERQLRGELREPARREGEKSGDESGKRFSAHFGKALTAKSKGFASGLTRALGKELELSAKTVATGFSAQFVASVAAGLASGAAKMAHGIGALAALLPAAVTTGVVAMGALKLAVSGVGDALEAAVTGDAEDFKKAIEGLSPAAQGFAREVRGMRDGLKGLKDTVQESFFSQFEGQVSKIGKTWLPILREELGGVAAGFGSTVSRMATWARTPSVVLAIASALANARRTLGNLTAGVVNLAQAFLPLVSVGATFLPRLTAGFGNATARLALFMQQAAATGKLQGWIQGGIDKLRSLWATAQQVWRIFKNIGTVVSASLASVGGIFAGLGIQTGGLLDSFEHLTGRAAGFVQTAKGSETVGTIFQTLGTIIAGAMGTLQRIAQLIGRVFGPIMPQISELFEAVMGLKIAFIDALEPALVAVGGVLGNTIVPALTKLAQMLTRNRPLLQGIGIAIATLLLPATISWAAATIAAAAPWILLGAAIAGFAALVIIHFDTIKSIFMGVFNWVKEHWPLLLTILTGPIGIAVALIVSHWDKIKAAGLAVFNWVKSNWPLLLAILTGPIGLAVLAIVRNWDKIKNAATAVKNWIVARWNDVVSFLQGIPGRITDAASGMWDGISDAFKGAINKIIGWWNDLRIPGFDININPPGPGSISFSWAGLSLPNIPTLAMGGIISATPGGSLFIGGEAGEDEAVAPLSKLEAMVQASVAKVALVGGAPAVGVAPATLTIDLTNGTDDMIRVFRKWIANNTTGDVQVALGPRR